MAREGGDTYHAEQTIRDYWTPRAIEARRQAWAAQVALIVNGVGCPDCYAHPGEPCFGLTKDAYHFGRGAAYARKG
jgi:hypothetical protein